MEAEEFKSYGLIVGGKKTRETGPEIIKIMG